MWRHPRKRGSRKKEQPGAKALGSNDLRGAVWSELRGQGKSREETAGVGRSWYVGICYKDPAFTLELGGSLGRF